MILNRFKSRAARIATATVIAASGSASIAALVQTAEAATTVGGTVECVDQRQVEGVYITAANGGSGWANRGSGWSTNFSYRLANGGAYKVTVGCGGSPSRWASSSSSRSYVSGNHYFDCYDFAYEGGYWCQVTG
jgi:hypothetical protein